jgi:hypothetical protein
MSRLGTGSVKNLADQTQVGKDEEKTVLDAKQDQHNRTARLGSLENKVKKIRPLAGKSAATSTQRPNAGKDISAWGDDMRLDSDHCRLLYNNCRGIQQETNFAKCHEIGDTVNEMNIDILGLAETNLDSGNIGGQ